MSSLVVVFTECVQNPCVNGGTCTGQHGLDFLCECPRGFTGEFCRDVSLPAGKNKYYIFCPV